MTPSSNSVSKIRLSSPWHHCTRATRLPHELTTSFLINREKLFGDSAKPSYRVLFKRPIFTGDCKYGTDSAPDATARYQVATMTRARRLNQVRPSDEARTALPELLGGTTGIATSYVRCLAKVDKSRGTEAEKAQKRDIIVQRRNKDERDRMEAKDKSKEVLRVVSDFMGPQKLGNYGKLCCLCFENFGNAGPYTAD